MKGRIEIDRERCKGCGICIAFCPQSAISMTDELNASGYPAVSFDDGGGCNGCAVCALVCAEVAIEVYRG